jgi:hypothetical protein
MASSVAGYDAASLAYPLLANRDGTGRGEKGHWVPTGEEGALAAAAAEFADDNRPPPPPLYRTFKVKGSLLLAYRCVGTATATVSSTSSVHGGLCTLLAVVLFCKNRCFLSSGHQFWMPNLPQVV